MEPKRNLTVDQRKMLDKLYSEQFDTKISQYRSKRGTERDALSEKILATERRTYAKMLNMGQKYYEWRQEVKDELAAKGLDINGYGDAPRLSLNGYSTKHPELAKFDEVTQTVIEQFNQKKNEMRTRIYGLATTYEDIEKELKSLLSGIKV